MLRIRPRREACLTVKERVIATVSAAGDAQERVCAVGPNREEVRMVRATAFLAVAEAARQGTSHASFRGFHINAARKPCGDVERSFMRVELVVRLDGHIIDRETVELLAMHFA
jgi:hypothetical protein